MDLKVTNDYTIVLSDFFWTEYKTLLWATILFIYYYYFFDNLFISRFLVNVRS